MDRPAAETAAIAFFLVFFILALTGGGIGLILLATALNGVEMPVANLFIPASILLIAGINLFFANRYAVKAKKQTQDTQKTTAATIQPPTT